jgi:hypothetical protein
MRIDARAWGGGEDLRPVETRIGEGDCRVADGIERLPSTAHDSGCSPQGTDAVHFLIFAKNR